MERTEAFAFRIAWAVGLLSFAAAFAACSGSSGEGDSGLGSGAQTDAGAGGGGSGWDGGRLGADSGTPIDAPYCTNGNPTAVYPTAPASVAMLGTLPNLSFNGLDASFAPKKVTLGDYFDPCAAKSRLLVVRVSAGWCGTCRWHAAHTGELTALDVGPRLQILDLLIANDENLTPSISDLTVWKSRIDAPQDIALDPTFQLAPLNPNDMPLPIYVLVDNRTMTVRNVLNNPDPDTLALRIHQEIAKLDHVDAPVDSPPQTFDGLFTRDQWDEMHAMTLPGAPPPDPTNAHADDPAAAALGKTLFFATGLSPYTISCVSCHDPTKGFADGSALPFGVGQGVRNSPSVLLASYAPWQFWDGRADSMWMQATGPIENSIEFDSTRLYVAHAIAQSYGASYTAIFGALPDMSNATRFPANGKPGDASYDGMAPADQAAVTTVFTNVGKVLEAYERTLRASPNALDTYTGGNLTALTADQKTGLKAFFVNGCAQCHWGPRMTDDAFHVTRVPTGRPDHAADRGRIDGIPLLLASGFIETGANSDSKTDTHGLASLVASPATLGAFKTPPLRGVVDTAPYGHGGTFATLLAVVQSYGTGGVAPSDPSSVGTLEPWLPQFDAANQQAIANFLAVLTAPHNQ